MMRPLFSLIISIGNDAFKPDPAPEIVRILRAAADELEQGGPIIGNAIFDANGNRVGQFMTTK